MLDIGKGGTISQEGGGLGLRKLLGLVLGGREAVVGGGGRNTAWKARERTGPAKLTTTSHLFSGLGEWWVSAEGQSRGAAGRWP